MKTIKIKFTLTSEYEGFNPKKSIVKKFDVIVSSNDLKKPDDETLKSWRKKRDLKIADWSWEIYMMVERQYPYCYVLANYGANAYIEPNMFSERVSDGINRRKTKLGRETRLFNMDSNFSIKVINKSKLNKL